MTAADALRDAARRLAHVPDPMRDARTLLAHAAGLDRSALHRIDTVEGDLAARFAALLDRRAAGEPLARILGTRAFWKHEFRITPDVLDPRADTEALVARALDLPWQSVLDLGTGSGCILLSLLSERPGATGVGTDISDAALKVAKINAQTLGIEADFAISDWFSDVAGRFDLIVSNPPYIAADEMPDLSPEVADHDPHLALSPGSDGLSAYRAIAAGARNHLTQGGHLMVEVGWTQARAVAALFRAAGLADVVVHPDLAARDRVVCAKAGAITV
ncbi:peptide chain release factor N(5)-glutamine methyltransferase [Palleronia abyssalis]|uniref:Release factor glutamine methyltransferase n=1 Tax=Palleronia abyssalis TaxID=1501240 RepID=A0A2R8BVB4_9RHOB|nr:peptide chain release factor N(5)-glutamine methyltransferase [Palleronia abyssalis]SPJ24036.1 Release factor glutamine methyltransferase [Palleronia abyssalis]